MTFTNSPKFENPTKLRLRLPFSKKSPLEQLREFRRRHNEIKEKNKQYKLIKFNQSEGKSGPTLKKLGLVHSEIDMINRKCIQNLSGVKRSTNYSKTNELMKALSNDSDKKALIIELYGNMNHKFRKAVHSKLDRVFEKLEKVTKRVGVPEVFKSYNFLLDGLDVDRAAD